MSGIDLLTVWDVDEVPSYDVKRPSPAAPCLVAVRTHAGLGRLELWGGRVFDLTPGTFAVFENERIARYRCAAGRWAFWWFEHRTVGPTPYPLYEMMRCPPARDEPGLVSRIMTSLRHPHAAYRMNASALYLSLATRWSRERQSSSGSPRHGGTIQPVIDEMYRRIGGRWPVAEMAKCAGVSERLFRQTFVEATGETPKRFSDRLRLDAAAELLRLGTHSVKEVAARLGFANQFHLSRAYRARFGAPPSRARASLGLPTPETRRPGVERHSSNNRASGLGSRAS